MTEQTLLVIQINTYAPTQYLLHNNENIYLYLCNLKVFCKPFDTLQYHRQIANMKTIQAAICLTSDLSPARSAENRSLGKKCRKDEKFVPQI